MAGPINLDTLDTPILEQTQFEPDMKRWLGNVVDIINASFTSLNNAFANLIEAKGVDIGGGGVGPINVPVIGLTATGFVNVTLISSSNGVSIDSVTPGLNQFSVVFSADPGASAIIIYTAFTVKP